MPAGCTNQAQTKQRKKISPVRSSFSRKDLERSIDLQHPSEFLIKSPIIFGDHDHYLYFLRPKVKFLTLFSI